MNKYLKNRYVIIGLLGIAFYLYKRRQILKETPKVSKPIEELEEKSNFSKETKKGKSADPQSVGEKLVKDVEEMDNATLKRTIETNKKMLKRAKMSDKRKDTIKEMLEFMQKEYADRTRNK
jgi:hypothetical protein